MEERKWKEKNPPLKGYSTPNYSGEEKWKEKESTTKRVFHSKLQRVPMLGLDSIYGKTNYKIVSLEKTLTRKNVPLGNPLGKTLTRKNVSLGNPLEKTLTRKITNYRRLAMNAPSGDPAQRT